MREPYKLRVIETGNQRLYKFKNGYGASVVDFKTMRESYPSMYPWEGWELAVIKWEGDDYSLDYSTDVTNDVVPSLTLEQVEGYLNRIEALQDADADAWDENIEDWSDNA